MFSAIRDGACTYLFYFQPVYIMLVCVLVIRTVCFVRLSMRVSCAHIGGVLKHIAATLHQTPEMLSECCGCTPEEVRRCVSRGITTVIACRALRNSA